MTHKSLPNVDPVPEPSLQSLTAPGVKLSGPRSNNLDSTFTISGRFLVSREEFERLGSTPHRDLVLTVLRDPLYGSYHPLKNCLIFQGDVEELSGHYGGWFSLDIWAYTGFRHEGIYYIRVSLGEALSNVIETDVVKTEADSTLERNV